MQVDHGVPRIGVPQQNLDHGQLSAVFKQVRGKAVSQRMRMDGFGNAGSLCGLAAEVPDGLRCNRLVRKAYQQAGEQPTVSPLYRAVVDPKLFQQFRAERHLPVFAALALTNAEYHALLVDVLGTEMAQLG